MSWTMKVLHLIFIALVLGEDAHGFSVWNGTSAVDWQAGHSNAQGNQNVALLTPVQAFKLLSRRGANVKGGSVGLSSAVQAGEHDPSFVQSSGVAARDVSLLSAQGQGSPTVQQHDMLTSGPSRLYSFESLDPRNYGRLVSQLQSIDNANLAYGSQNMLSSGQSIANPITADQLAVPQSLKASYPSQTSGRFSIFQDQVSTSPFQVSGYQTQSYQPSTTKHVSGASTLYDDLNAGMYLTSMGQTIPSSAQLAVPARQLSGFLATAYQPGTVTLVSSGQPAVLHAQSLGAYYPNKILGKSVYFQGLSSPSSQVPAIQTQSWYQPSTATQVLSGQSAVSQSQFMGAFYPSQSSGRYTVPQGQLSPSNSQVPGRQTQILNQPSYATQVLTGQSTSNPQLQFSDASTVFAWQASKRNNSWYPSVSSIQSGVVTNQMYDSQTPSAYEPSTPPQISRGRSSISRAPFSSRAESSENAKWYTHMPPHTISASFPLVGTANLLSGFQTQLNQPSFESRLLAGQSTIPESLDASNSYPSQTSGRNTILQGQMRPTLLPGFQIQSSHQPSTTTWFSADQSASTAQAQSSASLLNQGSPSTRYLTSLAQSSPFASQSAATSNQAYGSQTSTNQPFASFLPGRLSSTAAA